MSNKITKVPNLAKTTTDKILNERLEMEEEAPSAPISYTPDGTIVQTLRAGDKVDYAEVSVNDLAKASGIVSDPARLNLTDDKRHVSEKVYMNSDEFNELRRQLYEHHREVFNLIGVYMVSDPFVFVTRMNTWLGTSVQFDSWNEAGICKQFLDALCNKTSASVADAIIAATAAKYPKLH